MIYLKMLFEPKNLKRKENYYMQTMPATELVDRYSQDSIRETLLRVGLDLTKLLNAENGWTLSPDAFVDLFRSFKSIKSSEQEMQDCFNIIDAKEDGFIGKLVSPRRGRARRVRYAALLLLA